MADKYDYGEVARAAAQQTLTSLKDVADEFALREAAMEAAEEAYEQAKAHFNDMARNVLPTMFAEAGINSLPLADGRKIVIGLQVEAKMPEQEDAEGQAKAKEFLETQGYSSLYKRLVALQFPLGSDMKKVDKLVAQLEKSGLHPSDVISVHAAQLKAALKEMHKSGVEVPKEVFRAWIGQQARLQRPRLQTDKKFEGS